MTQLYFTLNMEYIQNLINTEVRNDMAKTILTKVFKKYSLSKRSY